MSGGEESTLT